MNETFDNVVFAVIESITAQEKQGIAHHNAVFNCFETYKLHLDSHNISEASQVMLMQQLEAELHDYYGSVKQ